MRALLIQRALLTDPAAGVDAVRDVLVVAGRVAEVAEHINPQRGAVDVVDASGLWLWPGRGMDVDAGIHKLTGRYSAILAVAAMSLVGLSLLFFTKQRGWKRGILRNRYIYFSLGLAAVFACAFAWRHHANRRFGVFHNADLNR